MFTSRRARSILFATLAISGGQLHAQLWDGGHSSSDNWGFGLNWDPNGPPANNGSANIIMSGAARLTPNVNDPWDISSLRFNNSAGAFTTGGSPLIIRGGGIENSSNNIQVFNNNVFPRTSQTWNAFSAPMVFNGRIEGFNASPTLTVDGPHNMIFNGEVAELGVSMELRKTGAGTLALNGVNSYTGATSVESGKLVLGSNLTASASVTVSGGTLELALGGGQNRVVKTSSLSVTSSGKIDLHDNKLIVTGAGAVGSLVGSTYTGVTGLIQSGKILTSQENDLHGIGVARASDIGITSTSVWAGQTVSSGSTLVMYTYGGDANLDGKLNIDDYVKIDQGIAGGLSGWSNGDFNYDGKVNIDDYTTVIDSNIGNQNGFVFPTASGGPASAGLSAVPEPASLPLALVTALGCWSRCRRRNLA